MHVAEVDVPVERCGSAPVRSEAEQRLGPREPAGRVVVGYDGSPASEAALEAAIREADTRGMALHVVCVLEPALAGPVHLSAQRRAAESALADAVNRAGEVLGDARVTDAVRVGSASAELLTSCRASDLLAVGTHGHRPVARMLLGSVSAAAVAHAPCPVLVARAHRHGPDAPVVVGVDGSQSSLSALAAAAELAEADDVPLRVVFALPPFVDALGFVTAPSEPEQQQARAVLHDAAAAVRSAYPSLAVDEVLVQAHPVDALLRSAQQARVAVVGSRGLGGLRVLLMGSVSRELVHRAPCSVLVVRARAAEPALRSRRELLRPA